MSQPTASGLSRQDKENATYVESPVRTGKTSRAVVIENDIVDVFLAGGGDGLLAGVNYDEIQASYPTNTQEIYTYKLQGVSQAVLTVNYTDSTKKLINSVVRS